MYNAFFGLTQNPFNMSPDPSFLFRSEPHAECPECGSKHLAREMSVFASSVSGSNGASQAASPAPMPRGCGTTCGCH